MATTLLSPPTAASILITVDCILAHEELVEMCADQFEGDEEESEEVVRVDSKMISASLANVESVCTVGEEVNALVSSFLLNNHATLLIFGVSVLYGSFSVIFQVGFFLPN